MFAGSGSYSEGGTEKLTKIVLGDGWTKGFTNTRLHDVPNDDTYAGKWVKVEFVSADINLPLTSDELMSRSNSNVKDYEGTWVWQINPTTLYTVILNPLGGYYDTNGQALPDTLTATVGNSVTLPTPQDHVSNGKSMKFVGWYTGYNAETKEYSIPSFDGGEDVDNEKLGLGANSDGYVTLYAKWSDDTTTHGTENVWLQNTDLSDNYTLVSSTDFEFDSEGVVRVPEAPAGFVYNSGKFKYTGTGTPTYNESNSTYTVTPTNNAMLNFYYDRITYTITFDKNEDSATGTMADQTMMGNVAQRLSANAFVCEGKTFLGWNTLPDGSGDFYTDKEQVKNLGKNDKIITLYAQWASGSSQSSSSGTYSFKLKAGQKVHFTNIPANTTYLVVETDAPNGWSQTDASNTSGTIRATTTSEAAITNTYNATGTVSLRAQKTMHTGTLAEGQFSFELIDDEGTVRQTVTNQAPAEGTATADILFDALEYNLSDLMDKGTYAGKKTYEYTIREVVPQNDDGVVYGSAYGASDQVLVQTIRVEVEDTGTGKLSVEPDNITTTGTGSTTTTEVTTRFTNDYKPGNLEVSKSTTGTNEASEDEAFSFTVSLKDAQGNPVGGRYDLVRIAQNGTETTTTNGEVTFSAGEATIGNIHSGESFRIEGIAQGTTYKVTETEVPDDGFTPSGVEGDEGTIGAGQTSFASFTNSYQAEGSVTLTATKTLEDGDIADYTFTFQLFDDTNQLLQTKTNDAQGNVAFDAIGFTAQDAGTEASPKEYSYKISEVNDKQMYIVYDIDSEWVTVKVWDDGHGHIHADAEWDNEGTAASFTNKLRNSFVLPATGGNGIAVPIAVSVIVATGEAARRMRRRRREE